ncbi:TIGR03643 family protein [Marinomonas atlantica]|uniref:TIGR03643 family protein n=1 Tax=Marinomonas atlantica TaxID=1806668 RepID=UPI0008357927|nr:TIGR03643 family protein [Marinomonas atlantica]MCO4786820.1 TIGR03643 family protein [Marinomonas atlantica]
MRPKIAFSTLGPVAKSRIIEMAWEDRTPFEAINDEFGLSEQHVIQLMRSELKPNSFRNWRARVSGRTTKHKALRSEDIIRGYAPAQYKPNHGLKKRV